MNNKKDYLSYLLIFISLILLITYAFNFQLSFASLFAIQVGSKTGNENSINPGNNTKQEKFSIRLQVKIHLNNTLYLISSKENSILAKIYDMTKQSLVAAAILNNGTFYETKLNLGIYNITIDVSFWLPVATNKQLNALQSTYSVVHVQPKSIILFLNKDKFISVWFEVNSLRPTIANVYDFDGNSILEYEKGEYLTVNTEIKSISYLLENNYTAIFSILYFNKYAIGIAESKDIFVFRDNIEYIFTKYAGPIRSYIDLNNINSVDLYLVLSKTKITDYVNT